jgi:hypothetical protein
MVLTKSELIASLQNEVRILLHLASKIDRAKLDYRPTPMSILEAPVTVTSSRLRTRR